MPHEVKVSSASFDNSRPVYNVEYLQRWSNGTAHLEVSYMENPHGRVCYALSNNKALCEALTKRFGEK